MNPTIAKRVPTFVGGALAFIGFRGLVMLPHYLLVAKNAVYTTGCLLDGVALLFGVSILVGSARAVRWAEIYLWLGVIVLSAFLIAFALNLFGPDVPRYSWREWPDLAAPILLLALLVWSRLSQHEPGAKPIT